jgi:hypothetical protein
MTFSAAHIWQSPWPLPSQIPGVIGGVSNDGLHAAHSLASTHPSKQALTIEIA